MARRWLEVEGPEDNRKCNVTNGRVASTELKLTAIGYYGGWQMDVHCTRCTAAIELAKPEPSQVEVDNRIGEK